MRSTAESNADKCEVSHGTSLKVEVDGDAEVIVIDESSEDEERCDGSQISEKSDAVEVGEDRDFEVIVIDDSDDSEECLVKDHEYTVRMEDKQPGKTSQTPRNSMMIGYCVGKRTRSCLGKLPRVSYTQYFSRHAPEEDEEVEEEEKESSEEDENEERENFEENEILFDDEKTKLTEEDGARSRKQPKKCHFGGATSHNEQKKCHFSPSKRNLSATCAQKAGTSGCEEKRGCSAPSPKKKKLSVGSEEIDAGCFPSSEEIMWGDQFKLDKKGQESVGHEGHHVGKTRMKEQHKPLETCSVFKLLVDTIYSNTHNIPADLCPPRNDPCYVDPEIFSWDDEDQKVVEKSDYEKEIDELWEEFDFSLAAVNMCTYSNDKNLEEERNKENLTTCCSKGKHCLILDDQIGIRCKFCSFVHTEIRYVLPSMVTNRTERYNGRSLNDKMDQHDFSNLFDEFKGSDGQYSNSTVTGTIWDLIPGVYATMYQHQREAFEFMWRNLAGSIHLDELKSSSRSDVVGGCVISHAPGTGKTRLSIVFIQTYMKLFPECRPVIIAPIGMLLLWEEEARKWSVNLPIHNLNSQEYSGMEDKATLAITAGERQSKELIRLVKLCSWNKGNSILGVSYNLFKKLTSDALTSKILLENPGLLVLDEGHIPRNQRSLIWKVLGKVKTEKRIILSGTPFQNNFVELYNILWLVRPTFAQEISIKTSMSSKNKDIFLDKEHEEFLELNDGKEIWTSLTSQVNDGNVKEVRSILKPFVHIHNGSILKKLPGLRECVIVLDPLPQQKSIIDKVNHIGANNNFESDYKYCLAAIHPSLITHLNLTNEEATLIHKNLLEKLKLDPNEGAKTRFVMEVVRLSMPLNEKVLIFSQYILPLEMMKEHLVNEYRWTDGKEVLQLDGKILAKGRQSLINIFNDANSEAKVLLASTKACCEGIHLTGASRVILLDVVWNPAVGRQAISRAYRLGQNKFVYTYNLITSGTGEREKYNKQTEKDHFSKLLFSPEIDFSNAKKNFSQSEEGQLLQIISEDKVLEKITETLKDMFAEIYYPLKEYCICT